MIRARIVRDRYGCLRSLSSRGHASDSAKGSSTICSAVTALVRTGARLLANSDRVRAIGNAAESGRLDIKIMAVTSENIDYLRGITDMVIAGLSDIATVYPRQMQLIVEEMKEIEYGT